MRLPHTNTHTQALTLTGTHTQSGTRISHAIYELTDSLSGGLAARPVDSELFPNLMHKN